MLSVVLLFSALGSMVDSARLYDPESGCSEDVKRLCPSVSKNEFTVVGCLSREISADPSAVSKECHQEIWNFKNTVMSEQRYVDQMRKMCSEQLDAMCVGRQDVMACLMEHRQDIEASQDKGMCKRYLKSMALVFFSDYHLISGFLAACKDDVVRLQCGVISESVDETESTQAGVISCLETKIKKVSGECKAVLTTKEEEAADSFQLDRALYLACRADRDTLCSSTPDDAGAVYDCLEKLKFHRTLSNDCRKEVVRRQLMALEDYKIDYGLKKACSADLVTHGCLEPNTAHKLQEGFLRTVLLMQCLTDISSLDDKRRVPVTKKCLNEVQQTRKAIMGDIELTPSLGLACHTDVNSQCAAVPKNLEGGVITCLMQLASQGKSLQANCQDIVEEFVEVLDPISDYGLNFALMANCGDYIHDHCDMEEGEGSVMKCMIEYEVENDVREECHLQVLSYKYFMSRSILLDKPLLRACRDDARELCMTEFEEVLGKDHKPHGAVISCLYHHLFMEEDLKLSKKCIPELQRTIISQGERVNLSPSIVSACTVDLVNYCSGFEETKDDYGCLQNHLIDPEFSLAEPCAKEMVLHAQLVADDVRNDYRLMKACKEVIRSDCKDELHAPTHGRLLSCIERKKSSLKGSCKQHVKDLQLVALHDFKFNPAFVEACGQTVQMYCKFNSQGKPMSKKQDVMYCLRNEIQTRQEANQEMEMTEQCKIQLRQEFMRQMKDLDLDPQLLSACGRDLKTTCRLDKFPDKTEIMECLRNNEATLAPECKAKVFIREVQQAQDQGLDPVLQKTCGNAIQLYCADAEKEEVLPCLEANLKKSGVTTSCKATVKARMTKEHANYQLNIALKKACKSDVEMFCGDILTGMRKGTIENGRGAIIVCLKDNMNKISVDCEDHVTTLLEQEVQDYRLDPVLSRFCVNDIQTICQGRPDDQVEGCLREHIMDIKSEDCAKQVVRLVTEAHSDVHLDPVLLRACQRDIGYLCGRVVPGKGQVIECLQANQDRDKGSLTPTCSGMLKSRVAMWSNAYQRSKQYDSALEMVDDLYRSVESSQYKHELITYLSLSVALLIFLSFCGGRITKPKPPSKLY